MDDGAKFSGIVIKKFFRIPGNDNVGQVDGGASKSTSE